jgi:hypothetical protein
MTGVLLHAAGQPTLFGYAIPIPAPGEAHQFFGAAFLLLGLLLIAEAIAGGVWHRSRQRTMIWPLAVLFLGAGMFVVALFDPTDRLIHFTVGLLLMAAGWAEARYRLRQISRARSDLFVIPALLATSFELGVVHARGEVNTVAAHVLLGLCVAAIAVIRLYQARLPSSLPRAAAMSVAVIVMAFDLLLIDNGAA